MGRPESDQRGRRFVELMLRVRIVDGRNGRCGREENGSSEVTRRNQASTSARKLSGNAVSGRVQRLRRWGVQRQRLKPQGRISGGDPVPDPDDATDIADWVGNFTRPPQCLGKKLRCDRRRHR